MYKKENNLIILLPTHNSTLPDPSPALTHACMLARLHAHMQKDMRQVAVNMYESLWKLGRKIHF